MSGILLHYIMALTSLALLMALGVLPFFTPHDPHETYGIPGPRRSAL